MGGHIAHRAQLIEQGLHLGVQVAWMTGQRREQEHDTEQGSEKSTANELHRMDLEESQSGSAGGAEASVAMRSTSSDSAITPTPSGRISRVAGAVR